MSDRTLAFIDPLETHFEVRRRVTSGYRFDLQGDTESFTNFPDQFTPYRHILPDDKDGISEGFFQGTLFRFPLRKTPSYLSDNVYSDEEKVDELLRAFRVDAGITMLFLRSLHDVEVIKQHANDVTPAVIVRVSTGIEEDAQRHALAEKERFSSLLEEYCGSDKDRQNIELTHNVTVVTQTDDGISSKQRWIVSHFIEGDNRGTNLSTLAKERNFLPWVGVAIPIATQEGDRDRETSGDGHSGRVFCFLPLPPSEESKTGLPVHVHGFFGVNSDRRGIKWPGPDQTDAPANWNERLVTELLPLVYVKAILIAISKQECSQDVTVRDVYRAWPCEERTLGIWKVLLEPFFERLFREKVIHTENKGWMEINNVIFNTLSVESDMEEAILKCLSQNDIPYATIPEECMQSLQNHCKQKIATITPSLLCRCLKGNTSIIQSLTDEERLVILEFILHQDTYVGVAELKDLELLPLDDGGFTTFSVHGHPVYIPTNSFKQELVPGAQEHFVSNLHYKPKLRELLGKIAIAPSRASRFQMRLLTLPAVADLLRGHPGSYKPANWLELIWTTLNQESPWSLASFEGIPLIPITGNSGIIRLMPLQKGSMIVQRQVNDKRLDDDIETVLTKIGATITQCPRYLARHPALLIDGYIQEPTPEGTIKILMMLDINVLNAKVSDLPQHVRKALRIWLSKVSLGQNEKNHLRKLNLFDRLKGTGYAGGKITIISAERCLGFIDCEEDDIPTPLKLNGFVIDARNEEGDLLKNLSIPRISRYEMVTNVVTELSQEALHQGYQSADTQRTLLWILQRWDELKDRCKPCERILKDMKFVHTGTDKLLSPCQVLDPDDPDLKVLFVAQGIFPDGNFSEPRVLPALRLLGMRGQDKLTADEIIASVDSIEDRMCISTAHTLLALLAKHTHLLHLSSQKHGRVSNYMKNKHCIPRMSSPPDYYPTGMEWHHASNLTKPSETLLSSKSTVLLCGESVIFTTDDPELSAVFNILDITVQRSPKTEHVIKQLAACVALSKGAGRRDLSESVPMIREIYAFLAKVIRGNPKIVTETIEECIWNGVGFSAPHKMCIHELPFDISPYITPIPQGMAEFAGFFMILGVWSNFSKDAKALVCVLHEIKKTCDESKDSVLHSRHLKLALDILRHLYSKKSTSEAVTGQLLVPSRKEGCHLIPASEGVYIDKEWLKQSVLDTEDVALDNEDVTLIHPEISVDLADFLNVAPLSRLLLADDFEGFDQIGQHEPLTLRLSNILKNTFSDPTTIFKEMIQNAEDAGAQEVRFLVDMRQNEDAKEKLFDPGMKDCQGPALWVYNDAVFSDEDFANITRLGGRTKERDATKIGKFGTGFNSVYHITDVPCVLSRQHIQYFDPHTTHLGKVLRNKTQPGVRVKLDGSRQFQRFPDQFAPFEGIFGFEKSEKFNFRGTLFRLPLRSSESARKSEICMESYDKQRVSEITAYLWKSSENLLVFTRHVNKVSVFFLDERSHDAPIPQTLIEISKISHPSRDKGAGVTATTDTSSCLLTELGKQFLSLPASSAKSFDVLRLTCMGSDRATAIAHSEQGREHGLSPEGSVAIPLLQKNLSQVTGEIFCYLSLSIESMLPFHINGSFAVSEDRRGLSSALFLKGWNKVVLTEVICKAYISLLTDEEFIRRAHDTYRDMSYADLWPDVDKVFSNANCAPLFHAFYQAVVRGIDGYPPPSLFLKHAQAFKFDEIVFMSCDIPDEVRNDVAEVLKTYIVPTGEVSDISEKTIRSFEKAGLDEIQNRTYDLQRFFEEVFVRHISSLQKENRNRLVLFALKSHDEIKWQLKNVDCILVSEDDVLKRPKYLVNPKSSVASTCMFSRSDMVFPFGDDFNTDIVIGKLVELGMVEHTIKEETLYERCHSIAKLHNEDPLAAMERCRAVLRYISDSLLLRHQGRVDAIKERLKIIPFLPVSREDMTRDKLLPWKCKENCPQYASAVSLYPHSKRNLVSSVSLVMEDSRQLSVPWRVSDFLELGKKKPTCQEVLQQLSNFREYYNERKDTFSQGDVEGICRSLYEYIDEACEKGSPQESKQLEVLRERACFFVADRFVKASQVAMRGKDHKPYLFQVPSLARRYSKMCERAGVREDFSAGDFQHILEDVYLKHQNVQLSEEQVGLVIQAAHSLVALKAGQRPSEFTEDVPPTFLPDMNSIMRPTSQLCYCDVKWVPFEENIYQCHEHISFYLAKKLKVKDVRHEMLEKHTLDFGQHEKLCSRIKRILESYPSDETILKELLQNADDAGATEMHIVYDTRAHNQDKIMGDGMQCLQGPALCVFNDRSFSDEDIRGIQNLGEGSKASGTGKIGRYGVGFNSVYQLTDCPSFISGGEKLCFFDPLLTHVPGASLQSPGRLFKINQKLRQTFPDVFAGYLEDTIPKEDGNFTMFRFPLRVNGSELSQNIWSQESIRDLLGAFEECAFESLLFLKNITKIRISEVDARGRISRDRTVSANYSSKEEDKRASLNKHIIDFAKLTQEDGNVSDWKPEQVTYRVNIDGGKRHEQWVVTQQVGFDKEYETDERLLKSQRLIPLGGVAARLPGTKGQEKVKGKSYCFLPLPLDTGLPLHVNGYFALDNESRRHLWESQHEDERSRWNLAIIRKIIAPCYVNLLLWIRDFFIQQFHWNDSVSTSRIDQTRSHLSQYHDYFPRTRNGGYWTHLLDGVYIGIAKSKHSLFPHLQMSESLDDFLIKWKTPVPSDNTSIRGYFFNPAVETRNVINVSQPTPKNKTLKEVLLQVNFPLIESPIWIMPNLSKAMETLQTTEDIDQICQVSPESVTSYLRGENPLKTELPMLISQTRLKDHDSLSLLIAFCKMSSIQLDGLPLLLTQDNILRSFSEEAPVFVSEYYYLFAASNERFTHKRFVSNFSLLRDKRVFNKLNISALLGLLKESAPFLETADDECKPLDKRLPCKWIQDLWKLIANIPKLNENDIKRNLHQWAILPVIPVSGKGGIVRLAPMSIADTILPHSDHTIGDALKALKVYTVHTSLFDNEDRHVLQLVCCLVAQVSDYKGVLRILTYWTAKDEARFMNLSPRLKLEILQYLSMCKDKDTLEELQSVPCFQAIDGKFINTRYSETVLVLPSQIPQIEQDIWMSNTNAIFLQYDTSLQSLYKRLGFTNSTEAYVYMTYIFPQFERFSQDCRIAHLLRAKEILSTLGDDPSAKEFKACLRKLPFVSDSSEKNLRRASEFFDPEKEIFAFMLTRAYFPSVELRRKLGLPFLRDIGLQTELTREQFIRFAHQVERSHSNTRQTKNISQLLIKDLKENCILHSDILFLQEIRAIRFLVASGASGELESIHKSKAEPGCFTMYSGSSDAKCELNWSTECAVPAYARILPPKCSSCDTDFYSHLDVKTEPDFSSVIKHLQKICNETKHRHERNLVIPYADKYKNVLMAIFAYLGTKCSGETCPTSLCDQCTIIQRELNHVPIVFLNRKDENILVRADQISRTIPATENLEPFVYEIQDCWGPYIRLLIVIGATFTPTISQFSFVLESLFQTQEQGVLIMNPNTVKLIETAVCGLFGRIAELDAESVHQQLGNGLYLPSTKGIMTRSDKLYLENSGLFKERLKNCSLPLVHIFEGLENNIEQVIQHLPVNVRPRNIYKCVKEVLSMPRDDADSCRLCPDVNCVFRHELMTILHSRELVVALTCLMANNKQDVDESTKQRIMNRLSQFGVTCMQRVRTVLTRVDDDVDIENSKIDVTSFVKGDRELVVQHSDGDDRMMTFSDVALKLDHVLKTNLDAKALIALCNALSQRTPGTILSIIKRCGFDQPLAEALTGGFQLPIPGSTVPDESSHLIKQDLWTSFQEGDYVAYSRHADGPYMYARVVKHKCGDSVRAVYLIDVGLEEHIESSVVHIHKIHISKPLTGGAATRSSRNTSDSVEHACAHLSRDVEEANKQVEEIWTLPEDQRKQATRRLLLKLNSDEHPREPSE